MTFSRKVLIVVIILFLFGLVSKVIVELGGYEEKVNNYKIEAQQNQEQQNEITGDIEK